jgi:hypothetical protein
VPDDFSESDYRKTRGIDHWGDTRRLQLRTRASVKSRVWKDFDQALNHARSIHIAGRLTRGNQKLHYRLLKCTSGRECRFVRENALVQQLHTPALLESRSKK